MHRLRSSRDAHSFQTRSDRERVRLALLAATALLAGASGAQEPMRTEIVAQGLDSPIFVTAPPNDFARLFVVGQYGTIRIVRDGVLLPAPFLDLGPVVRTGPETGLLGLAFHPSYATNGFFFVDYTREPDGATVIERYRVSNDPDVADPASATTFLVVPQPFDNHNAGSILFGPHDGFLYVPTGDGGSGGDPFNFAQDTRSPLGKVLRIDVDHPMRGLPYGIPAGNPFVGDPQVLDEIWSVGLRNPYRASFDRWTADLWIADVGQESREEIHVQLAGDPGGANYGWRCMEGSLCTPFLPPLGCVCNAPELSLPIHEYDHTLGCAIVGGSVYRGSTIAGLDGTYFFGDHCTPRLWSLRYDGTTVSDLTDRTLELAPGPGIHSLSGFGEDAAGEIYLTYLSGDVVRIVPASAAAPPVASYGAGTPGCDGAHGLSVPSAPVAGMPDFVLRCTHAPPSSLGLALVADAALLAGGDPFGLGAELLVDLLGASEAIGADLVTDASGAASLSGPIANDPSLVGRTFYAQALFVWVGGCSLPPHQISTSHGLAMTIGA